jgi:hypothetical protein
MQNVFRNPLVSKYQSLRDKVFANSFPRNAHMSQYALQRHSELCKNPSVT